MGCTQSKVDHEETVTRCKNRKLLMKDAVSSRNAFTAAHSLYAMSLKNTGAALTDYAHGEVHFQHKAPPSPPDLPSVPTFDTHLYPPPPPLPSFQSNMPPLQRAATMPADISFHKRDPPAGPIFEEEEEEDDDIEAETGHSLKHRTSRRGGGDGGGARDVEDEGLTPPTPPTPPVSDRVRAPPPPPPPHQGQNSWDYFFSPMENIPGRTLPDVDGDRIHREELERMMNEERYKAAEIIDSGSDGGGKSSDKAEAAEVAEKAAAEPPPEPPSATKVVTKMKHSTSLDGKQGGKGEPNANLLWIFSELDNCFLEASESAHDVSMMLEANRLHYHSNFADNRGHINHSERVMRAITWNRSFKGLPNADDGIDDLDSEEHETHATVLDKMLAWEKKLYDEVKAGEEMKLEYQRKVASLNKLKKRGARTESIEKAKAAVSHLHTRYIVDMQSMDSTVSEINRLRDEQLYPKLVALVDEMAAMWATMQTCHEKQSKFVAALEFLHLSQSPKETSDHHHGRTDQLWGIAQHWHSYFQDLMTHQKGYIKALNSWLKLNLIPIDNNLKEKVSSPQRPQNPPIQPLLEAWEYYLGTLPHDHARTAISNFAAIVHTVVECQAEEIKLRNRCEESRKDLARRTRQFEDWHSKYLQRKTPPEEMDPDRPLDRDVVAEKQLTVEMAKKKLEDDIEAYQRQCMHVREKSLTSLKTCLPELFLDLLTFSGACSDMYSKLRDLTASYN